MLSFDVWRMKTLARLSSEISNAIENKETRLAEILLNLYRKLEYSQRPLDLYEYLRDLNIIVDANPQLKPLIRDLSPTVDDLEAWLSER